MLNRKRETGFTLMEILITIALISLISVFAIPGIMSWMPDYRLKKAIGDMRSDFQRARLAAIRERATCAVEFNGKDTASGYTVYVDTNDNETADAGEKVLTAVDWTADYGGDVKFDNITFTDNGTNAWVGFRPTGLPRDANDGFGAGQIQLKNDKGNWRQLRLSRAGNIQIRGNFEDSLDE